MPPVGFEPAVSAGKRPQTYALDRAATRTGSLLHLPDQEQKSSAAENPLRGHCSCGNPQNASNHVDGHLNISRAIQMPKV